jgi:hypothetical protein
MNDVGRARFDGLASALLPEEGWEVLTNSLEPRSWRGLGGAQHSASGQWPTANGQRPLA